MPSRAESVLGGDAMIHFLSTVVPALLDLGVSVIEPDEDWDLQEREAPPVITFTSGGQADEHDWFDLSVRVAVGGEQVDFETLFVGLARDQEFLILPSGIYFALDRPEFRQLRELIAESRAFTDSPPGVLRVGRFQAGVWDAWGELAGQAADGRRAERGRRAPRPAGSRRGGRRPAPVPAGGFSLAGRAARQRARRDPSRRHGPRQDAAGTHAALPCPQARPLPGRRAGRRRAQLGGRGRPLHARSRGAGDHLDRGAVRSRPG
jgi:hypothetical protein